MDLRDNMRITRISVSQLLFVLKYSGNDKNKEERLKIRDFLVLVNGTNDAKFSLYLLIHPSRHRVVKPWSENCNIRTFLGRIFANFV